MALIRQGTRYKEQGTRYKVQEELRFIEILSMLENLQQRSIIGFGINIDIAFLK